tara:strand:- start:2037 stop:2165 length:129 start_codon:yes stop_codon:yes gene_type:complete
MDELREDAVPIAMISGLTRKQVADDPGIAMSTPRNAPKVVMP